MIFGREPAAIVGAIQAALALALSFGWLSFIGLTTQNDLAALMLVLNAGAALYLAFYTSETLLAPVIEFFKAVLALAAIYNLHITTDQTALAIALITAAFAAYQRRNVSPLSKGTLRYIAPDDTVTPQAGDTANYATGGPVNQGQTGTLHMEVHTSAPDGWTPPDVIRRLEGYGGRAAHA